MSAEICEWSDLEKSMCAHCRGLTLDDVPEVEYKFSAKFSGHCDICSKSVDIGDELWRLKDGGYACRRCAR